MKLVIAILDSGYRTLQAMSGGGLGYYHKIILNGTPLDVVLDKIRASVAEDICLTDNPYTKETKYTIEHLKLLEILNNIGKEESDA